jgi:hypothetical protein
MKSAVNERDVSDRPNCSQQHQLTLQSFIVASKVSSLSPLANGNPQIRFALLPFCPSALLPIAALWSQSALRNDLPDDEANRTRFDATVTE